MRNIVFIAHKISTNETREFTFDDLYGYEGEVCGVLLKPIENSGLSENGCWEINYNSGYGFNGINTDIEISIK
jgi:hypothetical protein